MSARQGLRPGTDTEIPVAQQFIQHTRRLTDIVIVEEIFVNVKL